MRDSERGGARMSTDYRGGAEAGGGGGGCCPQKYYEPYNKARVWSVTFMSYCFFHLARKVYSIVKQPLIMTQVITKDQSGDLYSIFLVSYALGMLMMGYLADRSNLRYFLSIMMVGSGLGCIACGLLHSSASFGTLAALYVVTGVFQSGGWPSNVAVMGVWFGKKTRGLVMGIWNAHTSVGNILGGLIATFMLVAATYDYADMGGVGTHSGVHFNQTWKSASGGQVSFVYDVCNYTHSKCMDKLDGEVGPFYTLPMDTIHTLCDADIKCAAYVFKPLAGLDSWSGNGSWAPGPAPTNKGVKNQVYFMNQTVGFKTPLGFQTAIKQVPWHLSFIVLGFIILGGGVLVFLFLVPHPHDVGLQTPDEQTAGSSPQDVFSSDRAAPTTGLISGRPAASSSSRGHAMSPLKALMIPGVIEFAICFFFAKFVSYTFLFWLPDYLESIGFGTTKAGELSTIFDYGGIVGGIACGVISDRLQSRAIIASGAMFASVPLMYIYRSAVYSSSVSNSLNGLLMFLCGCTINGTYALITTAVSADLGTALKGDGEALAMVTAIIDGTGSLGACITGVAVGWLKQNYGYNGVFVVLEISALVAGVTLFRLVAKELKMLCCPAPKSRYSQVQAR